MSGHVSVQKCGNQPLLLQKLGDVPCGDPLETMNMLCHTIEAVLTVRPRWNHPVNR